MSLRSKVRKILGVRSFNSDDDHLRMIPNAATIFDVGANVGQTAKNYRRLYPQANIWSFEPAPESFKELEHCLSYKFTPMRLALSDLKGSAQLNIGDESYTNSLLVRGNGARRTIDVATDTVDNICNSYRVHEIDILKIDVEGAETRVLNGAVEMFSRRAIKAVFIEVYFTPAYRDMPLFSALDEHLKSSGFYLHGLYSFFRGHNERLSFGNALYLLDKG
ncbi:FkbM family methyltransferase [Tunturiibacter gelidoferens]|uniref:FkbM family methyltransferase n=1 Tax=Tunturiibacter gelidiferens TaxID=3069689 RepID=A0ACC5NUP4_9BACT|nr:FkbM family methyltransferase [Edaphobacter lichenicola]MBB5338103.1 FkbM family methyltransferase [Edaphobacter lichenicola]